jgi:hypothetical protein
MGSVSCPGESNEQRRPQGTGVGVFRSSAGSAGFRLHLGAAPLTGVPVMMPVVMRQLCHAVKQSFVVMIVNRAAAPPLTPRRPQR